MKTQKRIVMGVNNWPEGGEDFQIIEVGDRTDEEAIAKAKELYSDDLDCYIVEVSLS